MPDDTSLRKQETAEVRGSMLTKECFGVVAAPNSCCAILIITSPVRFQLSLFLLPRGFSSRYNIPCGLNLCSQGWSVYWHRITDLWLINRQVWQLFHNNRRGAILWQPPEGRIGDSILDFLSVCGGCWDEYVIRSMLLLFYFEDFLSIVVDCIKNLRNWDSDHTPSYFKRF